MPEEVTIPGGAGKKLPGWVLWAAGGVIVLILLIKKGGGETTGEADTTGLLASELNQRLQEMEENLAQALANAQEQAPTDQTAPPGRPNIFRRTPPFFPNMPEADGLHPSPVPEELPFPPEGEPGPLPTPARHPRRIPPRPGGQQPPVFSAPSPVGIATFEAPLDYSQITGTPISGTTAERRRPAPLGTRTGHESRITFITEASAAPLSGHARAQAREETSTILNAPTNITERTTAPANRKKDREKNSQALKSMPKTITKQAPSSTQKMTRKGPTEKKGRKR